MADSNIISPADWKRFCLLVGYWININAQAADIALALIHFQVEDY